MRFADPRPGKPNPPRDAQVRTTTSGTCALVLGYNARWQSYDDINIRGRTTDIVRKCALEVSVQAKFHTIHLRKAFRSTSVRVV